MQYKIVFDPSTISPDEAQSLISHNVTNYTPANIDGSPLDPLAIPREHVRIVMPVGTTAESSPIPPHANAAEATPQPYLCSIPRPAPPSNNADEIEKERIASVTEAQRANKRGWELLEGMRGECIYHVKGWWAYEYCYGDPDSMVKQFHPVVEETGKVRWPLVLDSEQAWFILGRAQPAEPVKSKKGDKKKDATQKTLGDEQKGDKKKDGTQKTLGEEQKEGDNTQDGQTKPGDIDVPSKKDSSSSSPFIPEGGHIVNKGDTAYLTHHLESGTRCDLTYRHREIEIQYHCRTDIAHDWIAVVKEITTCSYLMVVQTPRLCKDKAFIKKTVGEGLEIKCRKISEHIHENLEENQGPAQESAELSLAELAEKQAKEKAAGPKLQYKDGKLVIGGTVIGGGKYFPIVEGQDPKLKQPENWRSSGTKTNPDGELIDGATEVPKPKTKLGRPTVGGPNIGLQDKNSKVVNIMALEEDHPDTNYLVVATGIIGEVTWEMMDEEELKGFDLKMDTLRKLVQNVDWKDDGKNEDGQRWYVVAVKGPNLEKDYELRAVVAAEKTLLVESNEAKHELEKVSEENKKEGKETYQSKTEGGPEENNKVEEAGNPETEEENLGGSQEEMMEGVKDEL